MGWIIHTEQLGKRYSIRHLKQAPYETLCDTLSDKAKGWIRKTAANGRPVGTSNHEEFWALRNVSFEVQPGEKLGIIGHNGAGKTTLLKILSRITEPSEGRVEIRGRVASLLEVGTGFHPELTGRENIFLNGAILGMRRQEIMHKFDEIVAFAEVERFIDTPVKRYSSGMYVRLAFAVAAHLEPEILIVDEVLAVGDVQFQKKCLGKMGEVSRRGRTVLFVSHNMGAIRQLCENCLWLEKGGIVQQGPSKQIIQNYLSLGETDCREITILPENHMHTPAGIEFKKIGINHANINEANQIPLAEAFEIKCEFAVTQDIKEIRLGMAIHTLDNTLICVIHQTDGRQKEPSDFEPGIYCWTVRLDLLFMPGKYSIDLFAKRYPGYWSSGHASLDWVQRAIIFHISEESSISVATLPTGAIISPRIDSVIGRII